MKRIFQVLAGLWLVGVLVLGVGSAWLQNNPEVFADAAVTTADGAGIDEPRISDASRERMEGQLRAAEAGWDAGASLPEEPNSESGGWAE